MELTLNFLKWTLPDFPTEHSDRPVVIHYPHFSTKEVHNNLVDW